MTKRIKYGLIAMFFFGLSLLIWPALSFAGGGDDVDVDVRQSNDNNLNNQTSGDVTVNAGDMIGGDTSMSADTESLALVNSLGDVDIADCLGSTQWSTPLFSKQKLTLNNICMADFYLSNGMWNLAAQALCNQPEILDEYKGRGISSDDAEAACEAAHNFGPREPEPEPTSEILEDFDTEQQIQDETIEVVQMAQLDLESRIEALEQRPEPAPRVVRAPAPAPEPAFSEEQRDAAWAALFENRKGNDDDE